MAQAIRLNGWKGLVGRSKKHLVSYLFVAPFFAIFGVFIVVAVARVTYFSFTYFNMTQAPTWIGLRNYVQLFTNDRVFVIALKNTFFFAIITGPVGYWISLVLAWLINEIRYRKFYTISFYVPSITSAVAISVVWMYIFASDKYGFLNYLLIRLGTIDTPILWLKDTRTVLPSIMFVTLWMSMGTAFLVFIAGLQSIPVELYEAGVIDGTTKWQQFWYITIPMLRPQLLFGAVMATVNSFQVFDLSYVMAGFPSLLYSAHTIVGHLYDYAFLRFQLGYASAVSVLLFFITMAISQGMIRLLTTRD